MMPPGARCRRAASGLHTDGWEVYSYSGILEAARGAELARSLDADKVADALRKSPVYEHYKTRQWWRTCDNEAFQDMWVVRGRAAGQVKGEWGNMDIVARIAASEDLERTCAEKGSA